MKKKYTALLIAGLCAAVIALCGCSGSSKPLAYGTGVDAEGKYDNTLFYRNDMILGESPDPGAFYNEADGYVYIYPTGAPIRAYRTKDFANWEYMGYVFDPDVDAWSYTHYWAPEVIKWGDKYYLYYNSAHKDDVATYPNQGQFNDRMLLGLAVSDSPTGPFKEWVGERDMPMRDEKGNRIKENGNDVMVHETIDLMTPLFDFRQGPTAYKTFCNENNLEDVDVTKFHFPTIDAHPYVDYDGTLYLYFVRQSGGNSIWGVKMENPWTPDYDTLTCLCEPGRKSVGVGGIADTESSLDISRVSTINEGPWMARHESVKPNGEKVVRYYLTYSIFGYEYREYSVCTAVADSPLGYAVGTEDDAPNGGFVKLDRKYGQPMLGVEPYYDHASGTGHHAFVTMGDEMFVIYHGHRDRKGETFSRCIAADRVYWVYNEELGYDILHANGPSYSLQPLPESASAYKNIAHEASVSATNGMAGYSASALNDKIIAMHGYSAKNEFRFTGSTEITLAFAEPRDVRAVMIYNAYDYDLAFSSIKSIVFEGNKKYRIDDLKFPSEYISEEYSSTRAGGAAVAVFNPIKVKKITIEIDSKLSDIQVEEWAGISVSEITVLGK